MNRLNMCTLQATYAAVKCHTFKEKKNDEKFQGKHTKELYYRVLLTIINSIFRTYFIHLETTIQNQPKRFAATENHKNHFLKWTFWVLNICEQNSEQWKSRADIACNRFAISWNSKPKGWKQRERKGARIRRAFVLFGWHWVKRL